jgi:hypothetical protein
VLEKSKFYSQFSDSVSIPFAASQDDCDAAADTLKTFGPSALFGFVQPGVSLCMVQALDSRGVRSPDWVFLFD